VGSTGAGVNIEQGVVTKVILVKDQRRRVSILLNGFHLQDPVVSKNVVHEFLAGENRIWSTRVEHTCRLPVGRGYGTSGAAAASLSLALNAALGEPHDRNGALRIAHEAEVKAKTGLGTVASVGTGGFAVRIKPGAPGVGIVKRLALSRSLRIVSGSFGAISTSRVLSDGRLRRRVNPCSRGLLRDLMSRPNEKNFLRLSRRFAECLQLISPSLRRFLELADDVGLVASMLMMGDGAFCIVNQKVARKTAGLMLDYGMSPVISRIYPKGATVI
jgi:pantoate kinase